MFAFATGRAAMGAGVLQRLSTVTPKRVMRGVMLGDPIQMPLTLPQAPGWLTLLHSNCAGHS